MEGGLYGGYYRGYVGNKRSYRDSGKENGNNYLALRVWGLDFRNLGLGMFRAS